MASKGLSNAKQKPFAVDTPIRKPVYEPGPLATAKASTSYSEKPACLTTVSQRIVSIPEWDFSVYNSLIANNLLSLCKATEQTFVEVSMLRIKDIFLISDFGLARVSELRFMGFMDF